MKNNYQIFKYLKPNENEMLSDLSGYDLQDLIILLNEYYLELRDSLGLNNNITFGTEIECEKVNMTLLREYSKEFQNIKWHTAEDVSLCKGKEIKSPILRDEKRTWEDLNSVCSKLKECSIIKRNAAGHIHVGVQILGKDDDKWGNFLKLWSVYENIIFRFSYGEYLSSRLALSKYAASVRKTLLNIFNMKDKDDINDFIKRTIACLDRYTSVNFDNISYGGKNTIEFRCPNGTLEPVIWQNNINFFTKLLLCANNNFNGEIVEKRKDTINSNDDIMMLSNEIFIEEAIELADMIFDNNLDKVYFLRQYLKSFDTSDKPLVKSKKFIA